MLGYVKGYDIRGISLKKAKQETFLETLKLSGVPEGSLDNIIAALEAKGAAYAWYKKKMIAAVYLIERIENYLPEVEPEELEAEKKKKTGVDMPLAGLRITEIFLSDEAKGIKPEFDEAILAEVRERVLFSEDEKIIECDGKFQYPKKMRSSGLSVLLYLLPLSLGLIFGSLYHNIALGLMFGMSFGIAFSLFGLGRKSAWEELDVTEENRAKAARAIRTSVSEA